MIEHRAMRIIPLLESPRSRSCFWAWLSLCGELNAQALQHRREEILPIFLAVPARSRSNCRTLSWMRRQGND